jgi:hypothetical protein
MMRGMGGGINLTPVSFLLETGTVLGHLFAKPASSFCHISAWIERRDKSQAQLVLRSFSVVGSSPIQSNPWQEFDGASSVFCVGMV